MKYYLKKKETLPDGLQRITGRLLEKSSRLLIDSDISTDTFVHETRKTSKKLRALLQLIAAGVPRKTFRNNNRALRDYARLLGGTRDSAARLTSLQHIQSHYQGFLDKSATRPVHEELSRRQQLASQQHADELNSAAALRQLRDISQGLQHLDYSAMTVDTLIAGLANSYRNGRRTLKILQQQPTTHNSHEFRKHTKKCWYQLRLLQKWNPEILSVRISQLDRLGKLLGQDHDLALLSDTLVTIPCCNDKPRRTEILKGLIETRRIVLLSQSLRAANQLYTDKTGRFTNWFESIQQQL